MATTSNPANMDVPISKSDIEYLIDAAEKTFEQDFYYISYMLLKEVEKILQTLKEQGSTEYNEGLESDMHDLLSSYIEDYATTIRDPDGYAGKTTIGKLVLFYSEYKELTGEYETREDTLTTSKALRTALKMLSRVARGNTPEEVFIRENEIPEEFLQDTEYEGSHEANMDVPISIIDVGYLIDAYKKTFDQRVFHMSYMLLKEAEKTLKTLKEQGSTEYSEALESEIRDLSSLMTKDATIEDPDGYAAIRQLLSRMTIPPGRYMGKTAIGKLVLFYSEYKEKYSSANFNQELEGEYKTRDYILATSKALRTALKMLSRVAPRDRTKIPEEFLQDTEYGDSDEAYDARLVVKSKLRYFAFMKDRLDQPRRSMFNDTCFGPWLNLSYVDNEEGLVHYMLQKQFHQKDESYDLPLVYYLNGHSLTFGRHEFCLITGFRFGMVSLRKWRYGDIPFRDRVFPQKVGQHVKLIDLFQIIEDEEFFIKLSDEDAIRVCLLVTLDVIFMGKDLGSFVDDIFLRMVEDLDEWNAFPWGELVWRQLYDSIRNVSSKHIPGNRQITGVNEYEDLPTYSLNGFVAAFKIWIIESTDKSKKWWNKTPGVIPRALAWYKHKSLRQTDYYDQLFDKDSKPNLVLIPSELEAQSEWYTRSQEFFKWYTPRAPPLAKGGPWEQFFQKAAEKKAREKSIREGSLLESRGKDVEVVSLEQRVKDLECRTFKLETIIQVITSEKKKMKKDSDDKVIDLADEYCNEVNEFVNLFDSEVVDVDKKADGLHNDSKANVGKAEEQKVEEVQRDKSPKMSDEVENRRKLIEKLNSPPIKRIMEKCVYKKRRVEDVVRPPYEEKKRKTSEVPSEEELRGRKKIQDPVVAQKLMEVKPWVEVLNRPFQSIDRVHVSFEMEAFLLRDGWRNCVFPWSDIVVDRYFWDHLIGFDDNRKGWLRDEHIELWIGYMWHTRPSDMDWSMVSCFFLPLLMKGTMPIWYTNKETYPLGWGEVERVFIPINEPELHWSLAEFHIRTGRITFIDSGPVYENEMRPFYLSVRNCLATRLPELLEQAGVFEQKEIDPNTYKITFNIAKNVPKQGGVFDDCGVWLCIFLYRLGNGKLLEVDNPVQVALAYRERLIRFYYKHKIHVA